MVQSTGHYESTGAIYIILPENSLQLLTDFENVFPARLGGKVATKWSIKILPYLRLITWDVASYTLFEVTAWLSGSALVPINEVTLRRARLVLGWVTVFERVNQPLRPTQPSTLSGTENEYWPKCGDALSLGSKRQVWFIPLVDKRVCGR